MSSSELQDAIDSIENVQQLMHYSTTTLLCAPMLIAAFICCCCSCRKAVQYEFNYAIDVNPSLTQETHEKHGLRHQMGIVALARYVRGLSWELVGGACQTACCCSLGVFFLALTALCGMPPEWHPPAVLRYVVIGMAVAIPSAFLLKLTMALFMSMVFRPAKETFSRLEARMMKYDEDMERRMAKMEAALDKFAKGAEWVP